MRPKVVYIRDIIARVVARVSGKLTAQLQQVDPKITGVHFEYGHYTDIQERLIAYSKLPDKKYDRYPLIAMFEDDRVRKSNSGFYGLANKKILILHTSVATKTRVERDEQVFKPILYPIYEEFLYQLWLSGRFNIYRPEAIEHDMIDRPHWGDPGLYNNEGYLFTDVLDGIELLNLNLQTLDRTCDIPFGVFTKEFNHVFA